MKVEKADRSLERCTLTISAEGQLRCGVLMVVRLFMISFMEDVKDQSTGWHRRGHGEGFQGCCRDWYPYPYPQSVFMAHVACTFCSHSHPSFRPHNNGNPESSRLPHVLCLKRQGSRWCILERRTLK